MKIERLHFPEDPYNFEIFPYPDGELQARLTPTAVPLIHEADQVDIDARVRSAGDMIGLALLCNAIRGVKPDVQMRLSIPYLPYARGDRRFTDGDCYGIEVFGDILRTCRFLEINTLDVHNPKKAFTYVSSFLRNWSANPLVLRAADDFASTVGKEVSILLPDAGAALRYKSLGEHHRLTFAAKSGNAETGELEGFTVPSLDGHEAILVVDDICDGGGTFLGIAQEIRKQNTVPLALYVTHGIFSNGIWSLFKQFTNIYTTNSFKDLKTTVDALTMDRLTVYDAWEAML